MQTEARHSFWGWGVKWPGRTGAVWIVARFDMLSYDSLLNMNHMPTNYFWWDTFITNAQIMTQIASTALNTTPGASVALQANGASILSSKVGARCP